jgi:hypothetical protein
MGTVDEMALASVDSVDLLLYRKHIKKPEFEKRT